MTVRRAAAALLALFRRRRLEQELESEVAAHLELAQRDLLASGLPEAEARRIARLRFGGIERMKEEHRDRRGFRWMENLLRDLRYGLAAVTRDPGFSAAVAGVLALGVGANVAMFSIVDAVLLKPLPFPHPDRIVRIWEAPRPGVVNDTTTLDFLDWKRLGTAFEAMAAELSISAALTGEGDPVRLPGKAVTADYFRVFAAPTLLGRTFAPEDEQPGAAQVVVLSHAAWQTYFGGDPQVLRRRPVIDGEPYQVIGVLPAGVFDRDPAQFWKPLIFTPEQRSREIHWLIVHGLLREGFTLAQARERMQAIRASLAEAAPAFGRASTIVVEPLAQLLAGPRLRQSMWVAFGAVALVLLIACANVANLLLAKGAARHKELAVRAALGASRGRLTAQLLTETVGLCALGGLAGVTLAAALLRGAAGVLRPSLPYTADLAVDLRVVAFGAAITLGVALLAGVFPAWQTSVGNVAQPLNQAGRGSSRAHAGVRRAIVIAELGLSLVLVCGALLLLRTLFKLQQLETGVRIENIITMSLNLPAQSYGTPGRAALFYEQVAQRLAAAPAVAGVGLASNLPLEWIRNGEGMQVAGVEKPLNIRFKRVDTGYFTTFGIPLLAGRGILPGDRSGTAPVVVINQALAARLADVAGVANPVGRRVRLSVPHYGQKGWAWMAFDIVGVIRSERVASPGSADPPVAYVPLAQVPLPEIKLILRTRSEPASVMPAIREAVREVDPNLPLGDVATMQQVRDRTLSGASRPAWLITGFALLASFLAAFGLYGVVSHAVMQQRREIGIRMALGARARHVVAQVLRNALALILVGLLLGLLGLFALTGVIRSLLFEVSPLDPLALGAACLALALIGLAAGFLPATRAVRVDPATTLRDEG